MIGKGCALRAGKEHYALRRLPYNSQFDILRDEEGQIFMRYLKTLVLKLIKEELNTEKLNPKRLMCILVTTGKDVHCLLFCCIYLESPSPQLVSLFICSHVKSTPLETGFKTDLLVKIDSVTVLKIYVQKQVYLDSTLIIHYVLQQQLGCTDVI